MVSLDGTWGHARMTSTERYVDPDAELRLKRLALQISVQLPEDTDDALRVLELARSLVTDFLMNEPATEGRKATVVPLTLIR